MLQIFEVKFLFLHKIIYQFKDDPPGPSVFLVFFLLSLFLFMITWHTKYGRGSKHIMGRWIERARRTLMPNAVQKQK